MTIPGSAPFASAPYGATPVVPVIGPEGGPYNVAGPLPVTVLASAARTATVSSATQANNGYKGAVIHFAVSANPGGAQTLALTLVGVDPFSGLDAVLLTVPATASPGGTFAVYPGLSGAAVDGVSVTKNMVLPAQWYVTVTHSGAGSWTYKVGVELIP